MPPAIKQGSYPMEIWMCLPARNGRAIMARLFHDQAWVLKKILKHAPCDEFVLTIFRLSQGAIEEPQKGPLNFKLYEVFDLFT